MNKREECVSDSELDKLEGDYVRFYTLFILSSDGEFLGIPRPRRSKSVDFSPIVKVEEVSRYKVREGRFNNYNVRLTL